MSNHLRWTSTFIHSLYAKGIRHIIISPGSRSTPLTIAAALHPEMETKVVLDERSAAFIALGIGKQTGIPAALICTSGTAAANYYPAVIEANESGIPMIVLSADRPPQLRGTGSSQTIDQIKLFGDQATFFHETGEPVFGKNDLRRLSFLAEQAVEASVLKGGAAHINFPFRKPLEPSEEEIDEAKQYYREKLTVAVSTSSHSVISLNPELTQLLSNSKKPLIIAGPCDSFRSLDKQAVELSEKLNAPILSEPGSNIDGGPYSINRFEQFLRDRTFLKKIKPDLIIRFGDQPFTKSLLTAFEQWQDIPTLHIASRSAWQDQAMSVTYRFTCRKNDHLNLSGIKRHPSEKWFLSWKEAKKRTDSLLQEVMAGSKALTDGHVFFHLKRHLSGDWNVMLSNSFPVRDMALFSGSESGQFVNRGAAGIDGILSTALGIHFSSEKPTCTVLGDLAFLHDSNALLSMKYADRPFVIIIVNNGGGTIFRMLPVHQKKELYRTYFETPQDVGIKALAKAYSIPYQKISTVDMLKQLDPAGITGPVIIECVTDPALSMEMRKKLWGE
ncbi:MAG: 2-succinyl-5-enolpyruvyl-6-hydroxy-3-cyclohexene-1-carboxylic-acid synthase [Balneolaceae bacterium]